MILFFLLNFLLIKNNIINLILGISAIIFIIFYIIFKIKNNNNTFCDQLDELNEKINKINLEINLLEKNNDTLYDQVNKNNQKNNLNFNLKNEKIKNNYLNKIENINLFKISQLDEIINKINNNKLTLHTLELDTECITEKLEKIASIEEKIEQLNEEEKELLKNNEAMELTKILLENAYKKMKENVTPEFTKKLSSNINKISNGKYQNVKINDEEGIIVEKKDGEYIEAKKLSIGTIDQLYISLRLATIRELSSEDMPIILDEAFAYYDTERLKNILKYLNEEFNKNQIIIFTCTDREREILKELNIEYNNIEL